MIHLHRPSETRYVAQTRRRGCRKWTTLGSPFLKQENAAVSMTYAMIHKKAHRGRVILTADWYEPTVVMEAKMI